MTSWWGSTDDMGVVMDGPDPDLAIDHHAEAERQQALDDVWARLEEREGGGPSRDWYDDAIEADVAEYGGGRPAVDTAEQLDPETMRRLYGDNEPTDPAFWEALAAACPPPDWRQAFDEAREEIGRLRLGLQIIGRQLDGLGPPHWKPFLSTVTDLRRRVDELLRGREDFDA